MREVLFEIYTWILCLSYLHKKQTSIIQSLYLYFIKIVPFWLWNIRFLIHNRAVFRTAAWAAGSYVTYVSSWKNGCQNFSYVHRSRKHWDVSAAVQIYSCVTKIITCLINKLLILKKKISNHAKLFAKISIVANSPQTRWSHPHHHPPPPPPHAITPAGPPSPKQKLAPPWPTNCQMMLNKLDFSKISPCRRSKSTTNNTQYMMYISLYLYK